MMTYIVVFQKSFQRMMAYRSATIAGVLTNFFFGLLRAYILIAVFQSSGRIMIGGYSRRDAITYTALTQAIGSPLGLINWWWDVMRTIRSGDIIMDLTKPYHFFSFWLARDMGRTAFQFIFRGSPILLFFPIFFELTWPTSFSHLGLIFLSVCLAALVSFSCRFLVNLAAFWFLDAVGIGRFAWMAMGFFSGFIVPVAFFPDWLRIFVNWTPMPAVINTPIEVYLGLVHGSALWRAIGNQLAWVIGMAFLCEFTYRRGVRRLVIQGG